MLGLTEDLEITHRVRFKKYEESSGRFTGTHIAFECNCIKIFWIEGEFTLSPDRFRKDSESDTDTLAKAYISLLYSYACADGEGAIDINNLDENLKLPHSNMGMVGSLPLNVIGGAIKLHMDDANAAPESILTTSNEPINSGGREHWYV